MKRTVSCPRLIGRAGELGLLEGALRRMLDGGAPAVVVSGEAGIGKSRLLRHFLWSARDQRVRAWVGHCVPIGDAALPYAPLLEILGEAASELGAERMRELAGPGGSWLAALVPELGWDATPGRTEPQAHQLTSLSYLLDRLAHEPALIVVEDLHWADQGTLDLLGLLVRARRRGRLLIVCTFRDDELRRGHPVRTMLAEWQRCGVERIALRRLDRAATAQQISGILGRTVDPAMADRLYARSGGNPFLAEELVAAEGRTAITEDLKDLLLLRFHELPAAAQQAGHVVALAGTGTGHGLLEQVTTCSTEELSAGLAAAVDRHVLVHDADAYAFRHALVAEAVAQDMLPADRRHLHRCVARALAAGLPGEVTPRSSVRASRLAQIAHHWYAGRDAEQALSAAVEAALAAEEIMAFPQAQLHYQHALALWPDVRRARAESRLDLAGLCEHAAEVAYQMDDIDGALELIGQAFTHLDAHRDKGRAGLLHERRGRYMLGRGDARPAVLAEYQAAVRLTPPEPSLARAQVLAGLAGVLMMDTRYAEAESCAADAVEVAGRLGAAREHEASALGTQGASQAMLGRTDEGLKHLRGARRLAIQIGGFDALWRAHLNLSDVLHYNGLLRESVEVATDGIERLDRLGAADYDSGHFRTQRACLLGNLMQSLFYLGRWDEMRPHIPEPDSRPANNKIHLNLWLTSTSVLVARGEHDWARAALDHCHDLVDCVFTELSALFHVESAELAVWRGDLESARDSAARAAKALERSDHVPLMARAEAIAVRLLADSAQRDPRQVPDITPHQERIAWLGRLPLTRLAAAHLRVADAELARITGDGRTASWTEAVADWADLEAPYYAAYTRWRLTESMLAEGGRRETAARALRTAHGEAVRLGAAPLAGEIEALAKRARFDLAEGDDTAPKSGEPDGPFGLTPREAEVLDLLGEGHTNRQIARKLFISEKTVSIHVSRILAKMNVPNRSKAAATAHRLRQSTSSSEN
ncbi:AAA family ATPase [Streptosporangiaceae bacterium NEAU-GS5]|nr:AAA family ATPase [Streptosporangiaceae bacterium NEAU-GS5]